MHPLLLIEFSITNAIVIITAFYKPCWQKAFQNQGWENFVIIAVNGIFFFIYQLYLWTAGAVASIAWSMVQSSLRLKVPSWHRNLKMDGFNDNTMLTELGRKHDLIFNMAKIWWNKNVNLNHRSELSKLFESIKITCVTWSAASHTNQPILSELQGCGSGTIYRTNASYHTYKFELNIYPLGWMGKL